ncbi:trypsin-like serine protease [Embleya sp. AB8]|uniref:trypsin-like serine protease n=1 Tax=Embleya sp. AB8 TaxID=3156304 RepID=UPI003C70CFA1
MTHPSKGLTALTALVTLVALATASAPAQARPAPVAGHNVEEVAAMPTARQAALLNPLRRVAHVATSLGKTHSRWSRVFSGTRIDTTSGRTIVYLTDPSQARDFAAAVRAGGADPSRLRVERSRFTEKSLDEAVPILMSRAVSVGVVVHGVAVEPDGSGLTARVADVEQARARSAELTAVAPFAPAPGGQSATGEGVPVAFTPGVAFRPQSRFQDTSPFHAGAYIRSSSAACTSGAPAVSTRDGVQWLVTAAHCFDLNQEVRTGNDATRVGTVAHKAPQWDAAFIQASTSARVWDGYWNTPEYTRRLTAAAWNSNGDVLCQLGWSSHVVCDLRVENAEYWYRLNGWPDLIKGVLVRQGGGFPSSASGDSGGPVIALVGEPDRQMRGIWSGADNTTGVFVQAMDIFDYFALRVTD